jgi:hypothetical protein
VNYGKRFGGRNSVRELGLRLLDRAVRRSTEQVEALLDTEFVDFGALLNPVRHLVICSQDEQFPA